MSRYSKIFAMLKAINGQPGVNLEHKKVVLDYTAGRTDSLKDLSDSDLMGLEIRLQIMAPQKVNDKSDKTRKAIISQFLSIGKTAGDAIAWAEKYGVNGNKRKFNDYSGQELYVLLQNAKKVKASAEKIISSKANGI